MDDCKDLIPNNTDHKSFPNELVKMFQNVALHLNSDRNKNDRRNNFVAIGNNNGMINAPEINIYINGDKSSENHVIPANVNRNYYNLFVIGTEEYEKNYFFVDPKRAVSKYEHTSIDIVEQFGKLDAEAIAQIKTFPSIFAAESRFINYQIDPTQKAYFGFVKDVKVQQNELIKLVVGVENK